MSPEAPQRYDVFVSHASEDKAAFVHALVEALEERGLQIWYDEQRIRLGDDFRRKMDDGLAQSRFGVVVLSPSFAKYWPEAELSALFNQERWLEQKRILPIFLEISPKEVALRWPLVAARAPAYASEGLESVVSKILAAVEREAHEGVERVRGSAAQPTRIYGAPDGRTTHFVGREEALEQLEDLLTRQTHVRVAASIEGLAGIGKTELVLQLVDKLAAQGAFPGGIFWLDAEKPDLTAIWGTLLAEERGLPEAPPEERCAMLMRELSRAHARVLVVLDNVAAWQSGSMPYPLPSGPHVRRLVTTRVRDLGGTQFTPFSVGMLPSPYDRELVTRIAERSPLPGLDPLLEYLAGHTLALELAGAYLRRFQTETPTTYLALLQQGGAVDPRVASKVRYQRTVEQALQTMWAAVTPELQEGWRLAACFEPIAVSAALADATGLDKSQRAALADLHLIETSAATSWRMHRLTREFARRAGTPEEQRTAQMRFVQGCVERSRAIDLQTGFRIYGPDRVHFEAALARAAQAEVSASDQSLLQDRIGTALQSLGDFRRAKQLLEQALESDLRHLGEDHPSVARSRSNLALVLQDLGELPRAKQLLEQALESNLRHLGEDHPSVARSRSNLATVLQDLGELPRAKQLLEQALESDLRHLGEDHPSVARSRSNLALVLQDLGELPRAKQLLEQALESNLRHLGEDHPSVATRRSNLALVLQDLGELPRAKQLLEQALESLINASSMG